MAQDLYPIYSYNINHNGTITSNRLSSVLGNVINKGGLIADNKNLDIINNNSGSILTNFGNSAKSVISYNKIEYAIYENNVYGGIINNEALDIYNNTAYSITGNISRSIVNNLLSVTAGIGSLNNNRTKGDILNNTCFQLANNTTIGSIWNNNITGSIIGNTSSEIKKNY